MSQSHSAEKLERETLWRQKKIRKKVAQCRKKLNPGWKSTAVHRWSPMFHQSPTGGPLRWHPQILRWPPVDHRWTTDGGTHSTTGGPPKIPPVVTVVPPVVTDCSTEGTMMMQVQQKSAEI